MQSALTNYTDVDEEIQSLLEEIDVVTELTKRCIAENSQTAQKPSRIQSPVQWLCYAVRKGQNTG